MNLEPARMLAEEVVRLTVECEEQKTRAMLAEDRVAASLATFRTLNQNLAGLEWLVQKTQRERDEAIRERDEARGASCG